MFVQISDKLVINTDNVTCISRDDERPKDVRISYMNGCYTLIGMESEDAAKEAVAKFYETISEKETTK